MILSTVYAITRRLLSLPALLLRRDVSKEAELLVLRHQNAVLRRELLDRMLILNEHHLRRTLTRYLEHYNTARPHRGIGQLSPAQAETGPPTPIDLTSHRVHHRTILGGLINEYQIAS